MTFKFQSTILTIVFASAIAAAQTPNVNARAALVPAQVKPGAQAVLKLTLEMPDDAHVNANAPRDPNLIPTVFTPQPAPGIIWGKVQYPTPSEVTEWYANDPLPVYQNGAVIEVPFTVAANATGTLTLGGTLLTQACDHEQCYPPRKVQVSVTLQLNGNAPSAAATQAVAPSQQTSDETATTDFSFNDQDGKPHTLSEFRGKIVLLDFWATWCKPCLADFPKLKELYAKNQAKGFEIIGLQAETLGDEQADAATIKDGIERGKAVAKRFSTNWTMADPVSSVSIATKVFKVEVLPTKILIGRDGKIIQRITAKEDVEKILAEKLTN